MATGLPSAGALPRIFTAGLHTPRKTNSTPPKVKGRRTLSAAMSSFGLQCGAEKKKPAPHVFGGPSLGATSVMDSGGTQDSATTTQTTKAAEIPPVDC